MNVFSIYFRKNTIIPAPCVIFRHYFTKTWGKSKTQVQTLPEGRDFVVKAGILTATATAWKKAAQKPVR
jgi:hypothetical protein